MALPEKNYATLGLPSIRLAKLGLGVKAVTHTEHISINTSAPKKPKKPM